MSEAPMFQSSQPDGSDQARDNCSFLWDDVLPPKGALWTAAKWWDKPIPADLAALWTDLACERWWRRTGWMAAADSRGDSLQLVTANSALWEVLEELSPEQGKTPREHAKEMHRALRQWRTRISPDWRQAKMLVRNAWAAVALETKAKIDTSRSALVGRRT